MANITINPSTEACPDFTTAIWQTTRAALTAATQQDDAAVAEALTANWEQDRTNRQQVWDEQREAMRVQQEADDTAAAEIQRTQNEVRQALLIEEARIADSKKPKLSSFNPDRMVGSSIEMPPAVFAIRKLERFEFVELWYFTPEGRLEAQTNSFASTQDAFALTNVDDMLALKSVSSMRSSKAVVKDQDLSWDQMFRAKAMMLGQMTLAGWSADHVKSLALMFYNLENHEQRERPNGKQIIQTYAARVRRDWHACLDRQEGYNISVINPLLMRSIADEIQDFIRDESVRNVSNWNLLSGPC